MSDAHGIARDQLRAFITRIERLEEEKKTIADDIKDVYGEAKAMGFIVPALREIIKIRKQDKDERAEREAILDTYMAALGMIEQPSLFDDEPYDRSTGEILDTPSVSAPETVAATSLPSGHAAGEAVDADLPTNIAGPHLTAVFGGEPGIPSSDDGGAKMQDARTVSAGRVGSDASVTDAQSEQAANNADQPVTGGDHEVDQEIITAANAGEGENAALPGKHKTTMRPNCLKPGSNCGGYGFNHCHSCLKAMREKDGVAA